MTVVALASCCAILLAGCRRENDGIGPDGRKQVRLFLMLLSVQLNEHYNWVEETFEARNPDIDLVLQQFPGSSLKDYEIKLRLRFASKLAPDVFGIQQNPMYDFARLGLLDPAPPQMVDLIEQNSRSETIRRSTYVEGVSYGPVSDLSPTVLYYNKRMFREAGLDPNDPPETWDELVEYADKLTVRDARGEPTRAGISIRKTGFKPGIAEKWFTFLLSAGGQPFNDDGTRATFNTEAGRAAIELYKEILFDRRIDSVDLEGDQMGFAQERAAMFIRGIYVMRWLAENYPDLEYGVANLPKKEASISSGGPYMIVVSADSPNKDESWRLVEFLMSDEVYSRYADIGGVIPVTKSMSALPRYADDPDIQVFMDQEIAEVIPFPRYQRAVEIIGEYIERFCYGQITSEEFLERAEREVNDLLASNEFRLSE